ncbi:MAG: hypothetical protein AB1420_02080 [Bacillota bacterium]
MESTSVMAILIDSRTEAVPKVQDTLTKYGYIINMRLGLHQAGDKCSDNGLIILNLCGSKEEVEDLENELNQVHRVKVKKMDLKFDD